MALIPLKQTVTIYPPGYDDAWNPATAEDAVTLRCRFQEITEVVTDQHGKQVVSSAQIFLDKYASITASHVLEFTDETGIPRNYHPISIGRKRWLNGKTILTVVHV